METRSTTLISEIAEGMAASADNQAPGVPIVNLFPFFGAPLSHRCPGDFSRLPGQRRSLGKKGASAGLGAIKRQFNFISAKVPSRICLADWSQRRDLEFKCFHFDVVRLGVLAGCRPSSGISAASERSGRLMAWGMQITAHVFWLYGTLMPSTSSILRRMTGDWVGAKRAAGRWEASGRVDDTELGALPLPFVAKRSETYANIAEGSVYFGGRGTYTDLTQM
ncbi:hypothetical protein C8R45DRAFT_941726 [Mycena sanguinolenta]|nr:hypothetical protein C8R45DRAFT_941726 [Mycena sanguinolenta]